MAVAYAPCDAKCRNRTSKGATDLMIDPGADNLRWFALQVRTRWENSTAVLLSGKGYQTLLPTFQTKKRWNGRVKQMSAPLFPGYVFCQFDALKRLPILVTPGVIAVVGRGRVPFPVNDGEIAAIQTIVASGFQAEPWPYLEVGQKIRIEGDSLNGLEGILIQFKGNNRIVVSVSLLRRSVALEIDRDCVRPVAPSKVKGLNPVASHALLQGVVA
jgi:transcription antitermination factor NusG